MTMGDGGNRRNGTSSVTRPSTLKPAKLSRWRWLQQTLQLHERALLQASARGNDTVG
jgi:hypothetical protein